MTKKSASSHAESARQAGWSDQRAKSTGTTKTTTTIATKPAVPQRSRSSIKKAYVRFDDYLDLNEENMRRSCKRIMNKLYCEPGSSNNSDQTTETFQPNDTNVCRPISPPPNQQIELAKSTNKSAALKKDDHLNCSATIVNRYKGTSLTSSESTEHVQLPNEKSYLRSQYERRQKRQLELMSKMQRTQSAQQHQREEQHQQHESSQNVTKLNLIGGTRKFNQNDNNDTSNINAGANNNICRKQQLRHQQDLVAKSHELSKRRFFEQLERRESIKKISNLSTQNGQHEQSRGTIFKQIQQQQQQQQKVFPSGAKIGEEEFFEESRKQISREPVMHRGQVHRESMRPASSSSSTEAGSNDHLKPKVYQSIVSPPSVQPLILNSYSATHDLDTLGMLTGPQQESILLPSLLSPLESKATSLSSGCAKELSTNELIGFHTHSLQQKRLLGEANGLVEGNCSKGVARMSQHKPLIAHQLTSHRPANGTAHEELAIEDDLKGQQSHMKNDSLPLDESAFEIKVPPSLSYPQDQLDNASSDSATCFIDRLWVVKQVDEIVPSVSSCCVKSNIDNNRQDLAQNESIVEPSAPMSWYDTKEDDVEKTTAAHYTMAATAQLNSNKMLISTASSPDPDEPGKNIARTGTGQLKEKAASSKKHIDTDASWQLENTIKLNASDNQQQRKPTREVINLAISIGQVNQDVCEVQYHDADKIKKISSSSSPLLCSDKEIIADNCAGQTTSKSAADKNNGIDEHAVSTCLSETCMKNKSGNKLQLADNEVASESGNHEAPEMKAVPSEEQSSGTGATKNEHNNNRDRIDKFNKAIANCEPVLHESLADQAKQASGETSSQAIANERIALIMREHGAFDEADASASEAAGLETIITNKLATRDVPPEANGKMLNRQIGADVSSAAAVSLPPLDDAKSGRAEKVALKVGMSVADRDSENCTRKPTDGHPKAFKLEENSDQPAKENQLKRHVSEELTMSAKQPLVGDEQQQREQALLVSGQQYANPRSSHSGSHESSVHILHENDMNHDQYDVVGKNSKSSLIELQEHKENVSSNLIVNHSNSDLIEPLHCKSTKSLREIHAVRERYMNDSALAEFACNQQSAKLADPTIEEDIRSSCSSSGFGASVSAASSSASSTESNSSSLPHHHSFRERKTINSCPSRRSNSLSPNGDQTFDIVRSTIRKAPREPSSQMNKDDHADADYGQYLFVGPDQAYPNKKGRPLLVENHGYVSVVNRCEIGPVYSHSNKNSEQTMEFVSTGQYANLPNGRAQQQQQQQQQQSSAMVEYATVRTSSQRRGSARIPPAENKKHSTSEDDNRRTSAASSEVDSESSSSGHNRSISSANSGGFSTLPPVRLIDHNNFANNFNFNESLESAPTVNADSPIQHHARKPSSLLKRFGSLVSKAFTLNGSNGGGSGGGCSASPQSLPASRVDDKALEHSALKQSTNFTESCEATKNCAPQEEIGDFCESENHFSNEKIAKCSNGENIIVNCGEVNDMNVCGVTDKGDRVTSGAHEPKVAEADLVILPTKHTKNTSNNPQRQPCKSPAERYDAAGAFRQIYGSTSSQRNHTRRIRHSDKLSRSRNLSRDKIRTDHMDCGTTGRRLSPAISISSLSSSLKSSLEYSSLISSSDSQAADSKRQTISNNRESHLRRASSLSDELESLMSPSEAENSTNLRSLQRSDKKPTQQGQTLVNTSVKHGNKASRISIDCVSPTGLDEQKSQSNERRPQCDTLNSKTRSLLRWFGNTNSATSLSPRADPFASVDYSSVQSKSKCVIKKNDSGAPKHEAGRHHSMNGFLSLIDRNHANSDHKLDRVCKTATALKKSKSGKLVHDCELKEPSSLIYSSITRNRSMVPKTGLGQKLSRTTTNGFQSDDSDNDENTDRVIEDGKCKSLNIYQSISRNYVKRHHHRRHHHSCGHHHHHHHCHKQSSSSRHAQCSMNSKNRCGQNCSSSQATRPCPEKCSSCSSKADNNKHYGNKASVWGQLIKISKSDGSQVIELQRAPGKSWGFFVARGAINNVKGIFISRMHDDVTSSSLTGLLSIGDRILSIDDFPIGPDFDILRVNQMISKKSKISLKVKPFKG